MLFICSIQCRLLFVKIVNELPSQHWTKWPKNVQWYSTRYIWNSRFSCKSISVRFDLTFLVKCCLRCTWTTLTKQYSYAMMFQNGRHNIIGYLPHKRCTLAIGQHCTENFLMHCWPRQKQPVEVLCMKSYSINFTKFTGKSLYQILFFNKVAGLRPFCELCIISKNTFLQSTLGRLLLLW